VDNALKNTLYLYKSFRRLIWERQWLGVLLIVVGLAALIAGIGGGIAQMFIQIKKEADVDRQGCSDLPTKIFGCPDQNFYKS